METRSKFTAKDWAEILRSKKCRPCRKTLRSKVGHSYCAVGALLNEADLYGWVLQSDGSWGWDSRDWKWSRTVLDYAIHANDSGDSFSEIAKMLEAYYADTVILSRVK